MGLVAKLVEVVSRIGAITSAHTRNSPRALVEISCLLCANLYGARGRQSSVGGVGPLSMLVALVVCPRRLGNSSRFVSVRRFRRFRRFRCFRCFRSSPRRLRSPCPHPSSSQCTRRCRSQEEASNAAAARASACREMTQLFTPARGESASAVWWWHSAAALAAVGGGAELGREAAIDSAAFAAACAASCGIARS